jgi:hypothetical protein
MSETQQPARVNTLTFSEWLEKLHQDATDSEYALKLYGVSETILGRLWEAGVDPNLKSLLVSPLKKYRDRAAA